MFFQINITNTTLKAIERTIRPMLSHQINKT